MKKLFFLSIYCVVILSCAFDQNPEETPPPEPEVFTYDFGDAPDQYSTYLLSNGAHHFIDHSFYLGSRVDAEGDGTPSVSADADTDDGVAFSGSLIPGTDAILSVTVVSSVSQGFLDVWIDFNKDYDWLDASEQILDRQSVVTGSQFFAIPIPASAAAGTSYMRVRLSTTGVSSTGSGGIGEVEDYLIQIQ